MYENTEIIVRLSSIEVQQALSIWLDGEAEQALRFMKEKIVDKTMRAKCKYSAARKMAPCHLARSNCACCRAGSIGRGRPTVEDILRHHNCNFAYSHK